MTLGAALAVVLLLFAALACGGDGGDDDGRGDDAPTADDLSPDDLPPDDPGFQATIDAVSARISATRTARSTAVAGRQDDRLAPTNTPAAARATPTRPLLLLPTIALPIPTATPEAPAVGAASYELSAVRNWDYANQKDSDATARIGGIDWIADGLHSADEFNAAERLVNITANIAVDDSDTLKAVLDVYAVADRLAPLDLPALLSLQRMAQNRPEKLAELTAAPWFRDGLTETEAAIVAVLYGRPAFSPRSLTRSCGILAFLM